MKIFYTVKNKLKKVIYKFHPSSMNKLQFINSVDILTGNPRLTYEIHTTIHMKFILLVFQYFFNLQDNFSEKCYCNL